MLRKLGQSEFRGVGFGDDALGGLGQLDRLGIGVVLDDVAVDRSLQVDDRVEAAALEAAPPGSAEKKVSTAFSHKPEVGVKWNTQRGWRASHLSTSGCWWLP